MDEKRPTDPGTLPAPAAPVTRIERTQELEVGSFWRARATEPDEAPAAPVLLAEVHDVRGTVHSVQIVAHPSDWDSPASARYETILIADFLADYEPDPRGERARADEMAEAHSRVQEEQLRLTELRARPADPATGALLGDDTAGRGDCLPALVERADSLASRQRALAEQVDAVQRALAPMTALFHEQALIAKVKAAAVTRELRRIEDSLSTVGLYTGEGVDVETLVDGDPADPAEPLHLFQRLLYMDEESLINVAYGGADYRDLAAFGEQLANDPAVLKRVAPYPRCVVAMQFRRRDRDYGDKVLNAVMNEQNQQAFLLVRNGERVHAVFSSIFYMRRLFPAADEFDRPFRGYDGRRITPKDLHYPRANNQAERLALHYRRLLVLLWGLYDRTDAIGSFALERERGHLNILAADVQKACFRFVPDDVRVLPDNRPTFRAWARAHNALVQSGSRVLCFWDALIDVDTAPGCHSRHVVHKRERCYMPDSTSGIRIVYRRGHRFFVNVPVSGWAPHGRGERHFNARVEIQPGQVRGLPYLCLDAVQPGDIAYYLNNRATRREYLQFATGLARAEVALAQDEAGQAPTLDVLKGALLEGGMVSDEDTAERQSKDAIRHWRARHRGRAVPVPGETGFAAARDALLHWLWAINGHGRDRRQECASLLEADGRSLLELRLRGPGELVALASPLPGEPDPRLGRHLFVQRIEAKEQKTQLRVERRKWLLPTTPGADEARIGADTAPAFAAGRLFASATHTAQMLARLREAWDVTDALVAQGTPEALLDQPIPVGMYLQARYTRLEIVYVRLTLDGVDVEATSAERLLAGRPFPWRGSKMEYWKRLDSICGVLDRLEKGFEARGHMENSSAFTVAWQVRRSWAKAIDRALAEATKDAA